MLDPLVGSVVAGRYRVERVIGEGGMGRVYLAHQAMGNTTRPVAIKVLLPAFARDLQAVARFLRECAITSSLESVHSIRVYDSGQVTDGRLYIAMEYVDGRTLAELLQAEPLPGPRAAALLRQICASLSEAHAKRIVHRDLKPENILVGRDPTGAELVKVLDFGISKAIDEPGQPVRASVTAQHTIVGSPPYMSPEQFLGLDLDARSDVYALGLIAYEMFTGTTPFQASTMVEWGAMHLSSPPAAFDETAAGRAVPERARHAIMRALSKRKEERQPSADVFLRELEHQPGMQDAARAGRSEPSSRPRVATTVSADLVLPASQSVVERRWLSFLVTGGVVAAGIAVAAAFYRGDRASDHGAAHPLMREACVRAAHAAAAGRCDDARRELDAGCTTGPGHMEAQHELEDHCQ
jgi:serine/threonine protein kinase